MQHIIAQLLWKYLQTAWGETTARHPYKPTARMKFAELRSKSKVPPCLVPFRAGLLSVNRTYSHQRCVRNLWAYYAIGWKGNQ